MNPEVENDVQELTDEDLDGVCGGFGYRSTRFSRDLIGKKKYTGRKKSPDVGLGFH